MVVNRMAMTKILNDIKDYLNINDTDVFDNELLLLCNSALGSLKQIGAITFNNEVDKDTLWDSLKVRSDLISFVKQYLYAKIRIAFDPPASSMAMEALKNIVSETEWRFYIGSEVKT